MEQSKILKQFSLYDLCHGRKYWLFLNHNTEVMSIQELVIWSNIQMQLKR